MFAVATQFLAGVVIALTFVVQIFMALPAYFQVLIGAEVLLDVVLFLRKLSRR